MKNILTKYLLIIIGIYFTNLLYIPVSNILHIPQDIQIIVGFIILLIFTSIKFNVNKLKNLINFKLTLFYLLASILVMPIFLDYKIWPNDIIRCILYLLIFYNLNQYLKEDYLNSLRILAVATYIVQVIFSILPLYFLQYYMNLSGLEIKTVYRISGSLVDANIFSYTLTFCYVIIFYSSRFSKIPNFLFFLILTSLTIYLVNLSGSRGGLLVAALVVIIISIKQIGIHKLLLLSTIFIALYLLFGKLQSNNSSSFSDTDKMTTVNRFFSEDEKTKSWSAASSNQRKTSLLNGFQLIKEDYFIFGPGVFLYTSVWESHKDFFVMPHNTFVYLYSMFGLLSFIAIYLLIVKTYRFTKNSPIKLILYLTLLTSLTLSVNVMFYPLTFFIIELITNTEIDKVFKKNMQNSVDIAIL